ncbi:MAG TPA: nitroreductase/quinone reductase family protein [Nitrososphaerales archaeon]
MESSGSEIQSKLEKLKSKWIINLVTVGRRTGLPRPVKVMFILLDGNLFVRTSAKTNWGMNLIANPTVQAELGDLKFTAETEKIDDDETIKNLHISYRRKYHLIDAISKTFLVRNRAVFFRIKT